MNKGIMFLLLLVLVAPGIMACGSDDSPAIVLPKEPTSCLSDLSGNWLITSLDTSTSDSDKCPLEYSYGEPYTFSQSGCTIVFTNTLYSLTRSIYISENKLLFKFSYPDDTGTTTLSNANVTVTNTVDSFSGTHDWKWTGPSGSCNGSTDVSGVMVESASPPPIPIPAP